MSCRVLLVIVPHDAPLISTLTMPAGSNPDTLFRCTKPLEALRALTAGGLQPKKPLIPLLNVPRVKQLEPP